MTRPVEPARPPDPAASAPPAAPSASPAAPAAPPPQRSWRRRLSLLVLLVFVAGMVAYWSRNRPVEVEVIYDFGRNSFRVTHVELAYTRKGKEIAPVKIDFPSDTGAPKRWRHTLHLLPGQYTVRVAVNLRGSGDREAEVKHTTRHVTVESSQNQRLVLRLAR